MTTTSITFQQANTTDGSYDASKSLPKPVTVEAKEPRRAYIGHPSNQGPFIANLVGFVPEPDSYDVQHLTGLPEDPDVLVGLFPVFADKGGFWTDTRVIEAVVSSERAEAVI